MHTKKKLKIKKKKFKNLKFFCFSMIRSRIRMNSAVISIWKINEKSENFEKVDYDSDWSYGY